MGFMKPDVYCNIQCTLGEGPLWDHRYSELMWVDIDERALFFMNDQSRKIEEHLFEKKIGFVAPATQKKYLVGLQNGLFMYDRTNRSLDLVANPESGLKDNRWNDGKCGPKGNIWAGTMSVNQESDKGALYKLDSKLRITKVYSPVTISNGLAWNPDMEQMYYVDSGTRSIHIFEYKTGSEAALKLINKIELPAEMGFPDGMTIDEDGMLWIAHWDGACIARWHPVTGQLISKIDIPAPRVTSCIFGNKDFSTLYVTTARTGLSKSQLKEFPLSGCVFSIDTNTAGKEPTIFHSLK